MPKIMAATDMDVAVAPLWGWEDPDELEPGAALPVDDPPSLLIGPGVLVAVGVVTGGWPLMHD